MYLNELKHYDEDVLVHFGVKGMKWGVRRNHPSGDEGGSSRKGLSSRTKKILAISAAVAVTAGAAYFGHKAVKNHVYKTAQTQLKSMDKAAQYVGRPRLKSMGMNRVGSIPAEMNNWKNRRLGDMLAEAGPVRKGKIQLAPDKAAGLRLKARHEALVVAKGLGLSGEDAHRYGQDSVDFVMKNVDVKKVRSRRR